MGQSSEFRGFWAAGCMAWGAHDLTCQARFLLRSGLEVTPVFEWGLHKTSARLKEYPNSMRRLPFKGAQ